MEQRNGIVYRKLSGISAQGLRIWGLIFLLCGAAGYGIFGSVLIPSYGVGADGMTLAPMSMITLGSIMQAVYYSAIPVFSFLLVEGVKHTLSLRDYATRIGILALVTELPYNLCMNGKVLGAFSFEGGLHFDFASFSLNPVFGTLLCVVVLYFFRQYVKKNAKGIFTGVIIWLVAFLWVEMLHIENAAMMLVIVPVLWIFRRKKAMQVFCGCIATFLCSVIDLGTMASIGCFIAPLTFMLVHFYNGERGEGNRYVNYLAYPAILLAAGLAAKLAF